MTLLEIFIFRGEQFLGSRVFTDSSVSIGRGNATLLRLDDREISRVHATIVVDGARLLIRDEGSSIGTRVNGETVREKTFREVDTIEIGPFRLKVARRSMKGQDEFDRDEPTETRIKVADIQKRLEVADATPLPTPAPFVGTDPDTSGVRVAKPTMQGGAMIISIEPQHHGPTPAPQARPAGMALPTQKLELISPALQPPIPIAPVAHAAAPALADSSRAELTAGVEDSASFVMRKEALPVPAAPADAEDKSKLRRAEKVAPAVVPAPSALAPAPPAPLVIAENPVPSVAGAAAPVPSSPDATPLYPLRAVEATLAAQEGEGLDEEDDEAEDRLPGFSLLELLDRDPLSRQGKDSTALRLEVIHHREGQVVDVQQLERRRNFPVTGRRLVRFDADGRAQLAITEDVGGHVTLNNRAIPLEEIRRGARDRKGVALLEMREGDHAQVVVTAPGQGGAKTTENHYHVRFVRLPVVAVDRSFAVGTLARALGNKYLVGALALHALVLFLISLLPVSSAQAITDEPRFAEVSLKQIQLEPPPEVKPPEPEPPAPKALELLPTPRTRVRMPRVRAPRPQPSALSALDMLKPAATASQSLKDVVSNINAVSVPADARSRFKVGGAIGKLPIGEVRVSTAGVARDATSSGRELLSKENVGALKGAGGSGNVRGVVKQAPPAALQAAGSGRLSRAQIQKVINEHVSQVQACYEKSLMRDHALAGKITFDWVIAPSGAVSSVRVRASTMSASAVSTCILQEIRGWVFPTPEGGSVSVTYPFIFSAQGF